MSTPPDGGGTVDAPTRVMLVDDSVVIRSMLRQILARDSEIAIVASASNGKAALESLRRTPVDVIVLDIEMPVMDGITAIPLLLAAAPDVKIIVASTLSTRNAEISLKALSLGATDYLPKPGSPQEIAPDGSFERELLAKVKSITRRRAPRRPAGASLSGPRPLELRRPGLIKPAILAIGSSTGGPQALTTLMRSLTGPLDVPVVITQHMPPTFTAVMAQHLGRACQRSCAEATDGETLQPGRIYVAPGGQHLLLRAGAAGPVAKLTQDPPENYCRPAVDPMLRSLAQLLGPRVLAVILTGMGADGLAGGRKVIEAGGTVIAQDEATSVVWGMPGAVAQAGLCSAVLPLPALGSHIARLLAGGQP